MHVTRKICIIIISSNSIFVPACQCDQLTNFRELNMQMY